MIVTTMTLHSAVTGKPSLLVRLVITNDGTGTQSHGNYDWKIEGRKGQVIKSGKLVKWPRKAKSTGQLLHRVMNEAYGSKP